MMMNALISPYHDSVLSLIGNTPLVRLSRVCSDSIDVYAKIEAANPGGSIKDRPALRIVKDAIKDERIRKDTVVIESSSGNMAIGLAQACLYYGLRFICVTDSRTSTANIQILRTYGAEVDIITQPEPVTGDFLTARLNRVQELIRQHPNSYWPNQYANLGNACAHYETMAEISETLNGKVDYLFCTTGTCGTLRGCADYIRTRRMSTFVYAVDAKGSAIFGDKKAPRLIPGHGSAIRPELFHPDLADQCIHVSDVDCIVGCRRLLKQEAIFAGGSSGGAISALERVSGLIEPGSTCVVILPDRGERYMDTIYSDEWVNQQFGDISHMWARNTRNE